MNGLYFAYYLFYFCFLVVLLFSHIFLTNFKDNVDNVKPITGTNELKAYYLYFVLDVNRL